MVAALGILIHFLGPLSSKMVIKIKRDKPISERKLVTYITPQRSYDGFTIIGASICCGAFSHELLAEISHKQNVYGILFFFLLGILLPSVIWKLKKKVVAFRGRYVVNVDSIFFLPLTALSEELIWRFFLPLLLITNLVESAAVSFCISSIGFILLHIPIGGVKSIAYMSLFTLITVISYLTFGILAAIAFHISHNLFIHFFQPRKIKNFKTKPPVLSETDW
ncbi:CPBP family intramembrane glutamic endopeptidase [Bacillus safensis]|uniref:CPBP family intramembrane glutamic endopeptidase n=1 Tax=Bacillus safensis TaxID=561879 RepID=UPI0020A1C7CC|nr:CPBP family intramembrane glutamic endopeptidase [Bacillus safensis]